MRAQNFVRVTAGAFKGAKLKTPGAGTHPMGERERIALFNMAGNNLTGKFVLDAYAGGGTLGIEALSRGAEKAYFVEKSPRAVKLINDNLKSVKCVAGYDIATDDVAHYSTNRKFQLIVADPPYDKFAVDGVVNLVSLLSDDGVLILSHPESAPEIPGLRLLKTHQYAAAHLSAYAK